MDLIETIRASWGFTGLDPVRVVEANAFGNVIVEASDGGYWRICPEELSCKPIASSAAELHRLRSSAEFDEDWRMAKLLRMAESELGALAEGCRYCLKVPAVLGGDYARDNLATNTHLELLAAAGDMARQIEDLPDGTGVRLHVVE